MHWNHNCCFAYLILPETITSALLRFLMQNMTFLDVLSSTDILAITRNLGASTSFGLCKLVSETDSDSDSFV